MDLSSTSVAHLQPRFEIQDEQGQALAQPPFPVVIVLDVPIPCRVRLVLTPTGATLGRPVLDRHVRGQAARVLAEIRSVGKPVKGVVLAVRLGIGQVYCRGLLANLKRLGLILRVSGGYIVAPTPPTTAA